MTNAFAELSGKKIIRNKQKLGPRRLLRLGLRDAQSRIHQIHVYDAPAEGAAVRLDQLHHVAETALIPLYMSPCKAKEYLMLSQPYTGAELAQLGIINYAVPATELDAKVDDLVQRLLKRGAYALARTKRLVNRRVVSQLNLTLDAGVAYEMVTQLQPLDIQKLG